MQNTTTLSDVLIIGAGPVGSYTARALALQGYKVTVLEKKTSLGEPICCAGIISPGCASALGIQDMPILQSFSGAHVFSPEGQMLELERSSVQAIAVDRGLMDMAMAESAHLAGANILYGMKVSHVEADDKGITVYTTNGSGGSYRGLLTIVATGFNPSFTHRLGLGRPADFAIGVQAKVETKNSTPLCVFTGKQLAPGFFSWLEPTGNRTALAGLLCRKNAAACFTRFLKYLTDTGLITSASKPDYRGVSLGLLPKTFSNRLMVVGDSAGQVKPITGGGLFYGLKAADSAISQVEHAFKQGDFSTTSLAGYQKSWKRIIGKDIRLGGLARRMYEKLDDDQIEKAFTTIINTGLAKKLAEDEGLKFDDHGRVVQKMLRMPAFYRAFAPILVSVIK